MDIDLSLGGIQDILSASLEVRDFIHNSESDGSGVDVTSTMAMIPKFVTSGWPQAAHNGINIPSFWVDVCESCQPDASSASMGSTSPDAPGTVAACCRPGVVPWTSISWPSARIAASNRVINGEACHLLTPFERFGILSWIRKSGNWGQVRGNNNNGIDLRDADNWGNYGVMDATVSGRCLAGSGPASWWSNGIAGAGLADLVGNIFEWEDCRMEGGIFQPKAFLNGVRAAGDAYLYYDDGGLGDGVNICHLSPGICRITDAVNGDEDVTISYVSPMGRFAGVAKLSAGMIYNHGDGCQIQLKTALDISSISKTGLASGVGAWKTIGKLLEDSAGKYLALPDFSDLSTNYSTYLDSAYAYSNGDSRALQRCGYWSSGAYARTGLIANFRISPSDVYSSVGLRSALAIRQSVS